MSKESKSAANWRELDAARRYFQQADSMYRSALDRKNEASRQLERANALLIDAAKQRKEAQSFLNDAEKRNEVVNIEEDEDTKQGSDMSPASNSIVEVVEVDANSPRSSTSEEGGTDESDPDNLPLARLITPDQGRKRTRGRSGEPNPPASRRRRLADSFESAASWIAGMEHFLLHVPHGRSNKTVSEANTRTVIRQVRVLASGEGITYRHWARGVTFAPGRPIDLSSDLDALYDEAVQFERRHGKDKGNGWLLRHPITKMKCYQEFLENNGRRS